jgi:hypothetical protein
VEYPNLFPEFEATLEAERHFQKEKSLDALPPASSYPEFEKHLDRNLIQELMYLAQREPEPELEPEPEREPEPEKEPEEPKEEAAGTASNEEVEVKGETASSGETTTPEEETQ